MKFLSTLLDGVTEYETLVSAVERHNTPAAVTGVSGIHKAHLIHSLCARTGRKALVLASDEGEGQRLWCIPPGISISGPPRASPGNMSISGFREWPECWMGITRW